MGEDKKEKHVIPENETLQRGLSGVPMRDPIGTGKRFWDQTQKVVCSPSGMRGGEPGGSDVSETKEQGQTRPEERMARGPREKKNTEVWGVEKEEVDQSAAGVD